MNKQLITTILLSLLFITACGPSSKNIRATQNNSSASNNANSSVYPYWVQNPTKEGYLSVVGSAKVQKRGGLSIQERVALLTARAELSRIYHSHVKSSSTTSIESSKRGNSLQSDSSTTVQSSSALRLSDAVILKKWTHPDTKELFLWLALPLK